MPRLSKRISGLNRNDKCHFLFYNRGRITLLRGVGRHLKRFAGVYDATRSAVDGEFGFSFHNVSQFDARMHVTPYSGSRGCAFRPPRGHVGENQRL